MLSISAPKSNCTLWELENKETFENSCKVNISTLSTDNYCHLCSQATINTPIFRYSNWPWDILNVGCESIYQSWLPIFSQRMYQHYSENIEYENSWNIMTKYSIPYPNLMFSGKKNTFKGPNSRDSTLIILLYIFSKTRKNNY